MSQCPMQQHSRIKEVLETSRDRRAGRSSTVRSLAWLPAEVMEAMALLNGNPDADCSRECRRLRDSAAEVPLRAESGDMDCTSRWEPRSADFPGMAAMLD